NPTKPPKNSLEKLGAKHATFGEAWKKALRAPLFRHRWLLPPTASDQAGSSLRGAKRRNNPGVASRGPGLLRCARPEHTEKRKARFIQGDRLEDGAELAMTVGGSNA